MEITREDLKKYENINSVSRHIRGAEDFTSEVMDYYMTGEKLKGIKLPHTQWDGKFRLRAGEISLLGGINGAGKEVVYWKGKEYPYAKMASGDPNQPWELKPYKLENKLNT